MSAKSTSSLFEIARQSPTELSKSEVMGMIAGIPNLPPPSNNWFQNFNLNSILMTTTTIAVVTAALVYFTNPKTPNESTGQINSDNIPPVEIMDSVKPLARQESKDAPALDMSEPKKEDIKVNTSAKDSEPVEAKLPKPADQTTNHVPASINRLSAGVPTKFKIVEEEPETTVTLSGTQLRDLKRQLIKYAKQDGLTRKRSSLLTLEYDPEFLEVNHNVLSGQLYAKYARLLATYDIEPGPDRRIVLDRKYIMVGDFTEKGFEGSALGRAMNIQFNQNQKFKWIIGTDTLSKTGTILTISRLDAPKLKGGLLLKTEEKISKPEIKLLRLGDTFPNQSLNPNKQDSEDGYRSILDARNRAVTIYNRENREATVDLNSKDLKKLKRQLYSMLTSDRFISSGRDNVRFLLSATGFSVNGQIINNPAKSRYENVLGNYQISYKNTNKILMSMDFILVGDFVDGEFSGSVQGKLDSEKLSRDFFSKELDNNEQFSRGQSSSNPSKDKASRTNSLVPIKVEVITPASNGTKTMKQFDVAPNQSLDPNAIGETTSVADSIDQSNFASLHAELYALLLKNKDIKNERVKGSVRFSTSTLKLLGKSRSLQPLSEYTTLFEKYGIGLRQDRRLLFSPKFLLLIDKEAEKRNRVWYYAKEPTEFMIYAGEDLDDMEKLTLKNN